MSRCGCEYTKSPGSTKIFSATFSRAMSDDESIITITTLDIPDLTVVTSEISSTDPQKVNFTVSGGNLWGDYPGTITVDTDQGQILEATIEIQVRNI